LRKRSNGHLLLHKAVNLVQWSCSLDNAVETMSSTHFFIYFQTRLLSLRRRLLLCIAFECIFHCIVVAGILDLYEG